MKKIAIEYSGEIRNLFDCFNNHYQNFILNNPDYEIDIFAHFWISPDQDEKLKKRVFDLIKPQSILFENSKDFSMNHIIPDPRFPHPTNRFYSMFYSMEKSNDIRLEYEQLNNIKYDWVIRLRTDTFFVSNIQNLDSYNKDNIHLQLDWAHMDYGLNDQFSFGPPDEMTKFLGVYSNLDKLYEAGCAVNPECLIGFNAQKINNLQIEKHSWNFRRWRDIIWLLNQ